MISNAEASRWLRGFQRDEHTPIINRLAAGGADGDPDRGNAGAAMTIPPSLR